MAPGSGAAETGVVEQRPAVAGTRVYVPAADGRIVALELASGEPVWEFDVGIRPTEPLVYGDRLVRRFGGQAALQPLPGRPDAAGRLVLQRGRRGDRRAAGGGRRRTSTSPPSTTCCARTIGRTARIAGRRTCKYRPSAGPLLVGKSLAVPGSVPRVDVFDTRQGRHDAAADARRPKLATEPLLLEPAGKLPARIVAVTGGLAKVWNVTLAGPAPVTPPALPIAPLTELPGLAIPIGKPPALPGLPLASRRDTFFDSLRRRRRERQPDEVPAAAVDEERLPGDVDHAVLDRPRDHRVGVDERRQRRPEEEPAARRRPGDARRRTHASSAPTITSRLCW